MSDFIWQWNNFEERGFPVDEGFLLKVLKKNDYTRLKGRLLIRKGVYIDELVSPVISESVTKKEANYKERIQKRKNTKKLA